MSASAEAFLESWPAAPWLSASLVLSAAIYARGWKILRRRDPARWSRGHLAAFLGGLVALFLALASPIEPFGALLLQVHMMQHLLLMMVAPPLLWLGSPMFPMIRGLPRPVRTYWVAPVLRSRGIRRLFAGLTHPAPAMALYLGATWLWHAPGVYEAALGSSSLHRVQHACFLGSSALFWYPVVRPYPARPRWSAWFLLPYLLIADVSNTVLSALFTFSDRVIYPHYAQVPRVAGISALDDQSTAGVLMWVPGSVAFLLPLFAIGVRLLYGRPSSMRRADARLSILPSRPGFDLVRVPILGRVLRWRHARLVVQLGSTALAGVVIADGLLGTRVAAMNLAGVVPWIHWRGFLILGLLAVGNLSCLACPFLVPRSLARRWFTPRFAWPRRLRSKWVAVALVAVFFWAYESFSLWDSPRATAWIAVGYFVVAFAVDLAFRGASFCKYLCPIGQFNFVQSLVSPMEVKVRDAATCATCRTKECIRGTTTGIPGCELGLYLPRKLGNLDCTFCLDCVHACPHDNVGILPAMPGGVIWSEARLSGVGRLEDRPDLAALVLVLVFAAFANAGGMTAPARAFQERLGGWLDPLAITTAFYLVALVVAPLLVVGAASLFVEGSDRWRSALRFSYALVPLGFGMWLSHYGFHLATSFRSILPATQRFVGALGWAGLGAPEWLEACCRATPEWLPRLEIVGLDLGLLLSLYCGVRIARGRRLAFTPWAVVMVALFSAGVWIVLQPMQMRGTLPGMGG